MTPKITFRGWAGHFIAADRCRFRLNTLIEYNDIKIVVSTVGLMETFKKDLVGFEPIGLSRYYETMAFHAKLNGIFWDADVEKEISFDSKWCWENVEDEAKVNDGHYEVVKEIVDRLENGDLFLINGE